MRLIDADRFEKEVMEKCGDNPAMFYYFSEVCGIARMQPTIEVPQWIPCSERLPKNQTESWWCTTEYLTCSKDGTIQVLCYSDGWNCSFLNADMDVWRDHEIKSVIAWMPLPSPYTENRKES